MVNLLCYLWGAFLYIGGHLLLPLAVSIYASILVSRRFCFYAEVRRAQEAVLTVMERFWAIAESRNAPESNLLAVGVLLPSGLALKQMGHDRAAKCCGEISTTISAELTQLATEFRRESRKDPPEVPPDYWGEQLHVIIESGLRRLNTVEPDFRAIWLVPKRLVI